MILSLLLIVQIITTDIKRLNVSRETFSQCVAVVEMVE